MSVKGKRKGQGKNPGPTLLTKLAYEGLKLLFFKINYPLPT